MKPAVRDGADPDRRALLLGLSALVAGLAPAPAEAKPLEAYRDFSGHLPALPVRHSGLRLGTRQPTNSEAGVAARILEHAPTTTPLDVMLYFERLKTLNRNHEAYNAGWKERWNPVIVAFFRETKTVPSGDTTPWCAASLNWALAQCGYGGGTHSASSGKFRGVAGTTRHPVPGDIVVFGATDPTAYKVGIGHVALFLAQTRDQVLVLGGNQKNTFGHQAICRKWLAKRDDVRQLHSFHAIRALRAA